MKTTGSFFTGGGLFDIGAIAAGYTPIWGVEKEDKIARVARSNSLPVTTADVTSLDLCGLARPDHFHASPPCPNFSIAKADGEETELDIAMAEAVCRALVHFKPDTFTLENAGPDQPDQLAGVRHPGARRENGKMDGRDQARTTGTKR
jgi:DNA (cytosine-5)-methyltransferase 1